MAAIMILTQRVSTRTGEQLVQISLPRIDALLDGPRYSLPPDTAPPHAAAEPPKPGRRGKWSDL